MIIETININELIPYDKNAKEHPKEQIEQIKHSIEEFSNNDPIAIDENNVVIEGHGRVMALKELGYEEVEVIRLTHLSEEQKKAYRLVHNKLTMNSDFDFDVLEEELRNIESIDMSEFDFELDFMEDENEVEEDDFQIELPEEPKSKLGDIYQLGNHRLMCGDSTKKEDVMKLMNGKQADMYLTDPPYNVDYEGGNGLKIENDSMKNDDFKEFLYLAFNSANEVMRDGAVFYIWHADSDGYNFRGACYDNGWQVRQCLIWNKNSLVMGRQDYQWKHEPCLYGWKNGAGHLWASDRSQTTVLEFDKPTKNTEHPTMKPVKLFDYLIRNNTNKNDIVLDSFGGSGTSIIASEQNDRICYTMELDPKYCDVIINRWEELTGNKAVLLDV